MPHIIIDPESASLTERFALVRARRPDRARFPESCVELATDAEAALAAADPAGGRYPAVVYGPSKSSEGQRVYYLVRWLSGGQPTS